MRIILKADVLREKKRLKAVRRKKREIKNHNYIIKTLEKPSPEGLEAKDKKQKYQALLNNCVDDDEAILHKRELEVLKEGGKNEYKISYEM